MLVKAYTIDPLQIRLYFEDDLADGFLYSFCPYSCSYIDARISSKLSHIEASLRSCLLYAQHVKFDGE
jgi:hypothetical protein